MKNILKITLVTFITLFLFSCDSSSTVAKKDPIGSGGGTAFKVEVDVTGSLLGSVLTLDNLGTTLTFNAIGKKTMTTGLADQSAYNIQVVSGTGQPMGHSCKVIPGNNNNVIPNADVIVTVNCIAGGTGNGVASIGKDYYFSECAVCHSSGSDDMSVALGAVSDLAAKYKSRVLIRETSNPNKAETIVTDMHGIGPGFNLMGRFESVNAESIDHIRAYLASARP